MPGAGFFDGLQSSIQNPLFLGGIGLMAGGPDGLQRGLLAGGQFQDQARKLKQQQAMQQGMMNMPGLSEQDKQVLSNSPELATSVLEKMYQSKFDPMAGLDKRYKEAQIGKLEREAASGGETPSHVREWQYFSGLPPEKQQQYLTMKRAEKYLDTGTSFVQPNPIQPGQNVREIPKDVSGKASLTAQGKAQGEAVSDLPRVNATAKIALDTIQKIRAHPGKKYGVGVGGVLPGIPGTHQRGFVNLVNQAKGQTFLQAYQTLKGGGQISNTESAKAETAIARLDRAQSEADFDASLKDLEDVINNGVAMANAKSRSGPSMNAPADSLPDPLGIR
jgi:hypothetical protein